MKLAHWRRWLPGVPRPEVFAEIARAALSDAGVPGDFRFDARDFALVRAEPEVRWLLHNAYVAYRAAGWRGRRAALAPFVATLKSADRGPRSLEEVRPHLVPVIRLSASLAIERLDRESRGEAPMPRAARPLFDGLVTTLAIDTETALEFVTERGLADWGTSFEELLPVACMNLRERSQDAFVAADGFYLGPWQDANGSARMLLPELFYRMHVRGDPVVMLPQRDGLLVAGSEDEKGLLAMLDLARPVLDEPRPLSGRAYVLRHGTWQRFQPTPGSEVARKLAECETVRSIQLYAEQRPLLEQLQQRRGEPIYVASTIQTQSPEGTLRSLAPWSEGVESLLPRTDDIALLRGRAPNQDIVLLTWEDAFEIVGARMQPVDCDPVRYRVDSFPTHDEWAALAARSKR